jgi:hypothetical protein
MILSQLTRAACAGATTPRAPAATACPTGKLTEIFGHFCALPSDFISTVGQLLTIVGCAEAATRASDFSSILHFASAPFRLQLGICLVCSPSVFLSAFTSIHNSNSLSKSSRYQQL